MPLFLRIRHDKGCAQVQRRPVISSLTHPMAPSHRTAAILVAAGRGLRAGAGGPKQYRSIGGQPVIYRAMAPFSGHPHVSTVQPVVNPDDAAVFDDAVRGLRYAPPVKGGATRQISVRAGLEALAAAKPDIGLIHDAARPFVSAP